MEKLEPFEKPKKTWGGKRENSGPKTPYAVLKERARLEGIDIGRAEFWMTLARDKAIPALEDMLCSTEDSVRFKAAKEVLDRALGKPKETHEISGKDGTPIVLTEKVITIKNKFEEEIKRSLLED